LEAAGACSPILFIDDFYEFLGRYALRGELDHDLAAADRDVFLVQGIKRLLAFLANVDQPRIPQDGKVMGNRGLGEPHLLDDLIDRERAATALAHDFLAGLIGNGFSKKDWIVFHRRLSIWYYIEVYLFVKGFASIYTLFLDMD
jgi:hypothetical protein